MVRSSTPVHAVIGAIVGVVLSFLPFSTVLGGAASGFLEGRDARRGTVSGALAGAIMTVPIAGVLFLFLGLFGFGAALSGFPVEGFALVLFFVLAFGVATCLYTIGGAAVGGFVGSMLAAEYPDERRRLQRSLGLTPTSSADDTSRGPDRRELDSEYDSERNLEYESEGRRTDLEPESNRRHERDRR